MNLIEHEDGSVYWLKEGIKAGSGFKNNDGSIALVRCPECGRENYAMNVTKGLCSWCPFSAN